MKGRFVALIGLVGVTAAGFAAARAVKKWLEGPEPEPFETTASGNGATETEWSNALDEELLSILVDPQSKKPLEYDEENNWLTSHDSHLRYPIQNGIPVMLIDKAERIPDDAQPRGDLPMTGLGEETIHQVREYRAKKAATMAGTAPPAGEAESSGSGGSGTSGNGVTS